MDDNQLQYLKGLAYRMTDTQLDQLVHHMKDIQEDRQEWADEDPLPLFKVDLTAMAHVTGCIHLRAADSEAAEELALEQAEDITWEHDGLCTQEDQGPEVMSVVRVETTEPVVVYHKSGDAAGGRM